MYFLEIYRKLMHGIDSIQECCNVTPDLTMGHVVCHHTYDRSKVMELRQLLILFLAEKIKCIRDDCLL